MKKLIIIMVVALLLSTMGEIVARAQNVSQETCPDGEGWIKTNLSGNDQSYTIDAGEGNLISEWCYKAGTNVIQDTLIPPQQIFTFTSTVLNPQGGCCQAISHVSVFIISPTSTAIVYPTPTISTPTATATTTSTATATTTPVTPTSTISTPTGEPTTTATPGLTPSDPPTPTPSFPTEVATLPPPKVTPEQLLPITGDSGILNMNYLYGMFILGLLFLLAGFLNMNKKK